MNTENWFDKFSVLEAKDNRKNLVDPIINNIYDKSVKKAYMEGSEYNKSLQYYPSKISPIYVARSPPIIIGTVYESRKTIITAFSATRLGFTPVGIGHIKTITIEYWGWPGELKRIFKAFPKNR